MTPLVMKFGGTSVGSADAFTQVAEIVVKQNRERDGTVVIVSAMSGVTNELCRGALTAAGGDDRTYRAVAAELQAHHHRVIDSLFPKGMERSSLLSRVDECLSEFIALCHSIRVLGEVTPRAMDAVTSLGEGVSAHILAALLRLRGEESEDLDATRLIVTDRTFQNAVPLMKPTRAQVTELLAPLFERRAIPVVAGFIGATEDGVTTTLGRGGSDYTAAILGDCINADEVWTFTDVDGVMTADPRIVPDARVIPILSYSEVGELAYFGAKVLHPRAIRPVIEREIPLWVKNTFHPERLGTHIVRKSRNTHGTIKAVTTIGHLSMVTVEGRGMIGVPGIAARTFAAVASQGTSVLMISQASSEQSICFVIPTNAVPHVIRTLEKDLEHELARQDIDRIWSLDDVVVVTAVGVGMRGTPGVAARLFGALGKARINVIAIAQGSSECSTSLVVTAADADKAIRQIHKEVISHVE
ncbi:MAG: aspartate kinase [Candidatus Bipolaricaulota bacterium]|nr:aspartate kinase [Candidatus Bipolaricaulota bacterium]